MAKKRLGKGMDALFFESGEEKVSSSSSSNTLRISEIEPNKSQPRTEFDDEAIVSLADSIRQHGVLQPILVRPLPTGGYQIVAGERRWRAARMVGLSEVPVLIKEMSDFETMQVALIENLQREDLNPIEEALGYEKLMSKYNMTQEQVAEAMGKSRPAIANSLRLLKLDDETKEMVKNGDISTGHAKALAGIEDIKLRHELAKKTVNDKLSVRQLEKIISAGEKKFTKSQTSIRYANPYATELEVALHSAFGQKTEVLSKADGSYTIKIKIKNKDELDEFVKNCGANLNR